jgi:hypothetical protein
MAKKWEHRRCERCRTEYLPAREAQTYCSPACRRAAAYGRERFTVGTTGRRRRRLEASGTVRNRDFSSIETIPCKPTKPIPSSSFDHWPRCKVCKRWEMLPRDNLPRHVTCSASPCGNPHEAHRAKPSPMASEPHNNRRKGSRTSQTKLGKVPNAEGRATLRA